MFAALRNSTRIRSGAVDTGMNYYVARHYTSRDMSWLHCCWGLGASCGPGLVTLILASGGSWRWGYVTVGAIQLGLALLFSLTLGLWSDPEGGDEKKTAFAEGTVRFCLRFWFCPLMMLLYCGIEFSMGLWVYQFLAGCRGFSAEAAGYAVAGYWGMLTAGRFLIGCVANRLGNRRQIRLSMVLSFTGALLLTVPGPAALILCAVGLIGFAFASFYPAMMHAAPERFDDVTAATVIGYQGGAAMLGAAVIPAAFGYLAARTTLRCSHGLSLQ
ncbi:MAG: MFS transporter [Lentisphaeria bacterium]|nr:MAG: MFS transporter [Lentisphaeria bacterium]